MIISRSPTAIEVVAPLAAPMETLVDPAATVVLPGKYVFTVPVRTPPLPSFPGFAHTGDCATPVTVTELLAVAVSYSAGVTVGVCVSVPAAVAVTTTVTVDVPPLAIVPMLQGVIPAQ